MSAFKRSIFHIGQKTNNRQSGLFLQHRCKQPRHPFRTAIEQNACKLVSFPERKHSLNLCGNRQARTFRTHNKNYRSICCTRNIPCRVPVRHAAKTVIISHHALQHCNFTPLFIAGNLALQCFCICKKQIQIFSRNAEHTLMEHRIDIVRSALKRSRRDSFFLQRPQARTGNSRLPASAGQTCK